VETGNYLRIFTVFVPDLSKSRNLKRPMPILFFDELFL